MRFLIATAPRPTTSIMAVIATGTALKTLLQVKPGATVPMKIFEWGISFKGFAAAEPVKVELGEYSHAATVTAHVAAGIQKLDPEALLVGDPTTDLFEVGTTATGYNSSSENASMNDSRIFDPQLIAPTSQYIKQYSLGQEPVIQKALFGGIRVHAPATVDAYAYMIVGW